MKYHVLFRGMLGWHRAYREFTNPYLAIQWAIGIGITEYVEWMVAEASDEAELVKLVVIAQGKCLRFDRWQQNLINTVVYGL